MQKKKLATKIASILLSAAMLVSTTMTALATDGEVSVAAEQTEVQIVAETADDEALEASEEDAAAGEEIAEVETVTEEEVIADEEIIEEITSEEAQENVDEVQVLDAEEALALDAEQVVVDENDIALANNNSGTIENSISWTYDATSCTLSFTCAQGKEASLPDCTTAGTSPWASVLSKDTTQKIQTIVIGEGITGIGKFNFDNNEGDYPALTTVKFASSIKTIGYCAFRKTGLQAVALDTESVTINSYAFQACNTLTTFAVNKGNVSIDDGAFQACNALTTFTVNEGDVSISSYAFQECNALATFTVNKGNVSIGEGAFQKNVALTSFSTTGSVTLNKSCFSGCTDLKTFTCGGTVEAIPDYAFYNCGKLETFTAKGVKTVGASAFDQCGSLASFEFSAVTDIGTYAFKKSGLQAVTLDTENVTIGNNAFQECNALTTLTVNKGNVSIGDYAFQECNALATFTVNKGNVSIGEGAFQKNVALTSFSTTGSVTLNKSCFNGCTDLKTVTCDGTVGTIPDFAFWGCTALTSCDIKGVETIGTNAFTSCSSLKSFDFSDVTKICSYALQNSGITKIAFGRKDLTLATCAFGYNESESKVESICYPGTADEWNEIDPSNESKLPSTAKIHCKADTVEAKAATCTEPGWKTAGHCDACGQDYSYPTEEYKIPKTGHTWGNWTTQSKATVFKAEEQKHTCTVCGASETRSYGKKLTPTITVNAKKIWLQKGQKTSAFKVSGLAGGDSIKSYKSSNTKIFTVTNKGVIKAGKKVGTAKLTVTLASGTKKVIPIVVQKRRVKTWHLYNLPAKVTLKKGATYTLSPVVSLITSTHKVTYKTSNKKVATVTSAGKIKGVKKGTATITVKSGTVTKKVKVTVK